MKNPKTPPAQLEKARIRAELRRRALGIPQKSSTEDRFAEKILRIPFSGCMIWMGHITDRGYGQVSVEGRPIRAHRAMWEREFGPVPSGMSVLHRCDVRCCVNPDHLFLGSQYDNMRDMISKGRDAIGDRHGAAKLLSSDIPKIRAANGTLADIAEQFGVAVSTISGIRNGHRWAHIPGQENA